MTVYLTAQSRLRSRMIVAAILVLGSVAAHADHIDPTLSRKAAQDALSHLTAGDRQAAIIRAMEGLPSDPGPKEVAAHPEAWSALWRAVAAKIVRLEGRSRVLAAISPDGTRMLVASGAVGEPGTQQAMPVMLIDTASGEVVGTPIPAAEADDPTGLRADGDLTFSADGRFAVATLESRNVFAVLDSQTGERLHEFGADFQLAQHLGFSADSRYLAATSPLEVVAWDVISGAQVFRISLPAPNLTTFYAGSGWSSDNRIFITKMENFRLTEILVADANGLYSFASGLDLEGRFMTYPGQNQVAVSGPSRTLVFGAGGAVESELPGAEWIVGYVRDGKALAYPRFKEAMSLASLDIDVWDMSGTALETKPSDYGRFNNFVLSPEGEFRGMASMFELSGQPYAGVVVPEGPELYQAALQAIGRTSSPASPAPKISATVSDDIVALRSLEFAREAQDALRSGDRAGALIASLKGLPADPQEEDFERFDVAHLMLFRAAAARAFRSNTQSLAEYGVTADGTRALVRFWDGSVHSKTRAYLYNAGNGKQIAEFIHPDRPQEGYTGDGTAPLLSPDGQHVAIQLFGGDRVAIFRTSDGVFERDLIIPNPDLSGPEGVHSASAGYSRDGHQVAVQNGGRLFLFDPLSGILASEVGLPDGAYLAGWGHDGRLYFTRRSLDTPMEVVVYYNGVFAALVTLTRASGDPDFNAQISPSVQSSNFIAVGDDEAFTVYDRNGQRRFSIGGGLPAMFVRQGEAVITLDVTGDVGKNLKVFSIDGAELEVRFEDYVRVDNGLFDQDGQLISYRDDERIIQWDGKGTPLGRELYDFVWAAIPDEIRARISEERISHLPQ